MYCWITKLTRKRCCDLYIQGTNLRSVEDSLTTYGMSAVVIVMWKYLGNINAKMSRNENIVLR